MSVLDRLAEQRIADAMAKGVFDDLPGAGRPLVLQDLSQVPEHLRAGYRLLKNAGFLPREFVGPHSRPYGSRPYRRVRGADRARLTEVMIKAPSAYGTWLTVSALLWMLAFARFLC